jgi:hypothetical protein
MLKSLLKEPLVHFIAIALAIFAVNAAINRSPSGNAGRIVITGAKIEQLASLFANTWQRPPSATELKGLIDDYAKEEIYNREALTLGLDKNDTLIRRRLRQKYEFLIDAEAEGLAPTDTQLEAYLRANPGKFEIDPMVAFRQVYLNPERHGDKIDQDAMSLLETLRNGASIGPAGLGDATLLPSELPMTGLTSISQLFGSEFAVALGKAEQGRWTGPVRSTFGLHVVRIDGRDAGRLPALDEVRAAVMRDWINEKRKALAEARFKRLLTRYEVVIETPPLTGAGR